MWQLAILRLHNNKRNLQRIISIMLMCVMEDSCKKVLCLLDTSVRHGAAVYRKLLKEEDVKGKYFSTKIQLLPDEVQIAKFEAYMQASRGLTRFNAFCKSFQINEGSKGRCCWLKQCLRKVKENAFRPQSDGGTKSRRYV